MTLSFRAKARSAEVEESQSYVIKGPLSVGWRFLDFAPSALLSE